MSQPLAETKRIEAAIRLAQSLDKDAARTGTDQSQDFLEARAQGITVFDLMRTHLLLRAANGSTQLVADGPRTTEARDCSDSVRSPDFTICAANAIEPRLRAFAFINEREDQAAGCGINRF